MYKAKQCKSPTKACREFCLECMSGDTELMRTCICDGLYPKEDTQRLLHGKALVERHAKRRYPLFDYRMGRTERGNYPNVPVLSAIRNQCIECVGTYQEIENCTCDGKNPCNGIENYKCPLYEFRFGTNPYIKTKIPSEKQVQARLSFAQRSRSET
jgi:hypothetical protein